MTLEYLSYTFGEAGLWLIQSKGRLTRTGSGEMARVVCTLQVSELDGGVLCSRVAGPRSRMEDPGKSSHMRALSGCICRVIGKPQLG